MAESSFTDIEESLAKSRGAVYYKCALQVNSSKYAENRGHAPMDEQAYNQQLLENCRKANIQVVGLADHGDVESAEALRQFLTKNGIHVFPGFEICSHEKVLMVCLFPENYPIHQLNKILGSVDNKPVSAKKTDPSNKRLLDIAHEVINQGGVWYAAHLTSDSGLLKLQKDGGGLQHIWKEEKWVIAGQVPAGRKEMEQNYRQIIENKDPAYKRENLLSVINAGDVEYPDYILKDTASCMIKMAEPSIEALKQAFLDGDSRIRLNTEVKDYHQTQIKAMSVSGGFLDGIKIHFSENLNALIGGRGTGKSTILEGLRYALGLQPKTPDTIKNHNSIVKENFANSRILLSVYSHELGNDYTIERYFDRKSTIYDSEGNLTHQTVRDLFPGIDILGQNEIYEIAKDRTEQLKLLYRFLPSEPQRDEDIIKKLKENRQKLLLARDKKEEVEGEVNQLNRLKEKQESFKKFGLDKKFSRIDLYEKEKNRIIQRAKDSREEIKDGIETLKTAIDQDFHYLSQEANKDLLNKDLIANIEKHFKAFQKSASELLKGIEKAYGSLDKKVEEGIKEWNSRHTEFENEIQKQIEKLPEMAGKSGRQVANEYLKITRELHAIQKSGLSLKQQEKYVNELKKERASLIKELEAFQHEQFTSLERTVKKLNNKALKNRLNIIIDKTANRQALIDFLSGFQGIGQGRLKWIREIENFNIQAFCEKLDEGEEALLEAYSEYGLTKGMAEKLVHLEIDDRLQLDEIQLKPQPFIELNINPKVDGKADYRPIRNLSTGQKCTAILHLLMTENKDPLIIDQPEDNLDNAFIAEQIVTDLRKSKTKRQFIFSTHNANIPVFGDAEWIGVLEADGENATLGDENVGAIDSQALREKVEEILEGGKRAFEIRRLKYGF